jgi:methionyl-tRNA formyltransferase
MKPNKQKQLRILFIGKADDVFSRQAAAFVSAHYPSAKIVYGTRQQPFPNELYEWEGDIIISYLSQWIIPAAVLQRAGMAALNFHPGPPEYPGIGCTNFAIYDRADEFGVTCHHMAPKVDTGGIVSVKRFPVYEEDTVYTLTQRCYSQIISMFYDIFYRIMDNETLPAAAETWKRKPYLRKELNEICRLTPEMSLEEIERRIKSTTYLEPWAYMQVGDEVFKLSMKDINEKTYVNFLS